MEKQIEYNDRQMQSMSLANLNEKNSQLIRQYGNREKFLTTFNPSLQIKVGNDVSRCLFSDTPTLAALNEAYGSESASMWLVFQLNSLSEFCGCKDKLVGDTLKECSILISREYYYLKVSEFLLFFYQFKCGRYGKFYGAVDPLVIMTALREFSNFRNERIALKEQEDRRQLMADARKEHITHEQWLDIKKRTEELCNQTKTYICKDGVLNANEYKAMKNKKK